MPRILWNRYFLKAQGITLNICFRIKTIMKVIYLFVKDSVRSGDLHIKNFPSVKMVDDFFKKKL